MTFIGERTLRTASIRMSIPCSWATSQAWSSSSRVPHLVATEPFWSNSPKSHCNKRRSINTACHARPERDAPGHKHRSPSLSATIFNICSLKLADNHNAHRLSSLIRWGEPDLSDAEFCQTRNFLLEVLPPAQCFVQAVPSEELHLERYSQLCHQ